MSYRSVKKILGETSLERKCRFLLGAGMLILIASSFWFYSYLNSQLIYDQNLRLARAIAGQELVNEHWNRDLGNAEGAEDREFDEAGGLSDPAKVKVLQSEFLPKLLSLTEEDEDEVKIEMFSASQDPESPEFHRRPRDDTQYQILELLRRTSKAYVDYDDTDDKFRYYHPVIIRKSCVRCHYHQQRGHRVDQMIAMTSLSMPLKVMEGDLELHRAILIATALVTAFLAMLGAYAIVRYVIVKPVLHLKDVSDEIARGNLDLRADIRTGDEFEELSHAFNRMLRHLVTVQEELKNVNHDLDSKVDELAHVNLQLYEMNNMKDEFLATMSHELRTPLNSILGFSDVLAEASNLEDKQQRYVTNIQTSGRHLMSLINDILDLAKIESGKMDLQLVQFDLADFIERQVGIMQPLADRKNIELTHSVAPELEDVFQDRGKLQQILNNLLSNALKFTPEGGRVSVRARTCDQERMEILVIDTGVGIRLEDQEQVFEKFRQGKAVPGQRDAITREYEGTGLGLSIVKELTRLLGGEVFLESEFGKGSTFGIRIPVFHEPELGREEADPLSRYTGVNRTRISDLNAPFDGVAPAEAGVGLPALSERDPDPEGTKHDPSDHDKNS